MAYRRIPDQQGHQWLGSGDEWVSPETQDRPAIIARREGSQWVAVFADWPNAFKAKGRGLNKAANALLEKLRVENDRETE